MWSFPTIFGFIADFLSIFGLDFKSFNHSKLKRFYKVIWKSSSKIKSFSIFSKSRQYFDYFYKTKKYSDLADLLTTEKSILVRGSPLSGKTRTVYESLKNSSVKYSVLIPNLCDIDTSEWAFPINCAFWRRKIIFIDDLHLFVKNRNFNVFLQIALKKKIRIIATCQSRKEFENTMNYMRDKGMLIEDLFEESNYIDMEKITQERAKRIANELDIEWSSVKFDGHIGSIFMKLSEMKRRFSHLDSKLKICLLLIKELYLCGLYTGNIQIPLNCVYLVGEKKLEIKIEEWDVILSELVKSEFIELSNSKIQIEEVYLNDIIVHTSAIKLLELFESLFTILVCFPEMLSKLGEESYRVGSQKMNQIAYYKFGIKAYRLALQKFNDQILILKDTMDFQFHLIKMKTKSNKTSKCMKEISKFKNELLTSSRSKKIGSLRRITGSYLISQINLGVIYQSLGILENPKENYSESILCYKNALKNSSRKMNDLSFGIINLNLSNVYRLMAETTFSKQKALMAIESGKDALSVFKKTNFPLQHVAVLINIGNAFTVLAFVDQFESNLKNAIGYFLEGLNVLTENKNPQYYSMITELLGSAYSTLAAWENTLENCEKAIRYYSDSLIHISEDEKPYEYALLETHLADAYTILAPYKLEKENYKIALRKYDKSIKLLNEKEHPEKFAAVCSGKANCLRSLSFVENSLKNLKNAVVLCEESLKFYSLKNNPLSYASVNELKGHIHNALSALENPKLNIDEALNAYRNSLKVFSKKKSPNNYLRIRNGIGTVLITLGDMKQSSVAVKEAVIILEDVLNLSEKDSTLFFKSDIHNNLGIAYMTLAKFEKTIENCSIAQKHFDFSLQIRTIELFPVEFAQTMMNLGILSHIRYSQDKQVSSLLHAIEYYKQALMIRTKKDYPLDYAQIHFQLFEIYIELAKIKDKRTFCRKALESLDKSESIFLEDRFPIQYKYTVSARKSLFKECNK